MWRVKYCIVSLLCLWLAACSSSHRGDDEIYIGTISGPETELMNVAKKVAAKEYQLQLKVVTFEDYVQPNTAVAEGDLDANMFQHQPYLDIVLNKQNYALVSIGKMFVYPMGIYSKRYSNLQALPIGATIAIPNDPSNAARALHLLKHAKLISFPALNDLELTPAQISHNPRHLKFKEVAAAQLPRLLPDVDAAIINTNFAIPAGLSPESDALLLETRDSPYANIVVIRRNDRNQEKYQRLLAALHSPEVVEAAKRLFGANAIQAW